MAQLTADLLLSAVSKQNKSLNYNHVNLPGQNLKQRNFKSHFNEFCSVVRDGTKDETVLLRRINQLRIFNRHQTQ